jgi:hypothetical protein
VTATGHHFLESFGKIVVAMDLATTRCCLATAQILPGVNYNITPLDVKLHSCWTAAYESGSKWPITALFYQSDRLPKTGNVLEVAFKQPRAKFFDFNKHFRQWKLLFHDHQNDPTTKKIQDQILKQLSLAGKVPLDLLNDWVEIIYNELIVIHDDGFCSLKGSRGRFAKEDIEIVVTVPPGRSVLAHDQVHKAFMQGPIGPDQVFLVSEPEAMFRSWIQGGMESTMDRSDFKVSGL